MTMKQKNRTPINITLEENENLKLSLEDTGIEDAVIIGISGLIDTYNSEFFRIQATKVIEAGYRHIIINASAATFMSSTGIGAFTALLKNIRQRQGSMIIYAMPPRIYEVFQLLGFTSFFQFCDTREDALERLDIHPAEEKVFPVLFSCPVCHRRLKASRPGRFRCASCRVILAVNPEGYVQLG